MAPSATIAADRADRHRFGARVREFRRQNPSMPLDCAMECCAAEIANSWLKAGFSKEQVSKAIAEFNPVVAAEVLALRKGGSISTERFSATGVRL